MTDIFISYASSDRERIKPLVEALEKLGWSLWWDTAILPGVSWNDEIAHALDSARCVVVVWTSASIQSEWVKEESREGQKRHVLIPVLLDHVEIPLGFRGIQAANLADWQGHSEHPEFQKVVQSIGHFAPLAKAAAAADPGVAGAASHSEPVHSEPVHSESAKVELPTPATQVSKPPLPFNKAYIFVALGVLVCVALYFVLRSPTAQPRPPAVVAQSTPTAIPTGQTRVNPKDQLKYVYIPAGTFNMGCSDFDEQCFDNEKPQHSVTIGQAFWIGQTEVTQAAYRTITELSPSAFKGDALPVESITWFEAKSYCESMGLDLPTEAQWEYAARANDIHATYGAINDIAWFNGNSAGSTHASGQKTPNAWGLYDTLGNVWEWVQDWYDGSQKTRVARGGSWFNDARSARVSYRFPSDPAKGFKDIGFRCAGQLQ